MKRARRWLRTPKGSYVLFPVVFVLVEAAFPIIGQLLVGNFTRAHYDLLHVFTITSRPLWTGIALGIAMRYLLRRRFFKQGPPSPSH